MSGGKILDKIEIEFRKISTNEKFVVYIDIFDNSLSQKWLGSLNRLLNNDYLLEKNYCFFGFSDGPRNGPFLLDQINQSISAINLANIGYQIDDFFTMENTLTNEPDTNYENRFNDKVGRNLIHTKLNWLHRYFEDLQGVSGSLSKYYLSATPEIRWHIRQLNLLCHEFESWALSWRKEIEAPDWRRPSQLMCWLNAPRFVLDDRDYELFGIDTINRPLGGVFVGVNKAVGKHHWEVFNDEGRDSRIGELISSTLRGQTEASGDFDIEWAQNPGDYDWQHLKLKEFREWLIANNFDPDDRTLTIGHPQVGQVDLNKSFSTTNHLNIWNILLNHLDVYSIKTSDAYALFDYHWSDLNFIDRQVKIISQGH